VIKEQAMIYLERTLFLVEEVRKTHRETDKSLLKFDINEPSSYPDHIQVLLGGEHSAA
jgi:hypothetical protein